MADPNVHRALDQALRAPDAWLDQAQQLKRAADVLLVGFQDEVARWINLTSLDEAPGLEIASSDGRGELSAFSLGPVYLMVAGYAIENLAKGLIVARDDTASTIKWITKTHVSPELLSRAHVVLVDGEPDLVKRLALRVEWGGRYAVPKRAKDLAAARVGSLWQNVMRVSTGDGLMVNTLFERMESELAELVAQRVLPTNPA